MSDLSDYTDLLPALQAIPQQDVLKPAMPITLFIQEAMDLYHWSMDDKDLLLATGFDEQWLDALMVRAGALSEAEKRWRLANNLREVAEAEWMEKSPPAFAFRDELVHIFRYVFRKNSAVLSQVREIAEGATNVDMIQDLKMLAALGRQHTSTLEAAKFDIERLSAAETMAENIATLLAKTNGERLADHPDRVLRDRAYTYLKEAVDEVRDCGKYVFYKNPSRWKGYVSGYRAKWRNAAEENAGADTATLD